MNHHGLYLAPIFGPILEWDMLDTKITSLCLIVLVFWPSISLGGHFGRNLGFENHMLDTKITYLCLIVPLFWSSISLGGHFGRNLGFLKAKSTNYYSRWSCAKKTLEMIVTRYWKVWDKNGLLPPDYIIWLSIIQW